MLGKLRDEWTETANDDFQSWLIATYGGNYEVRRAQVSDFDQDIGVLNDDVEAIAREIDPSLVTYEPFEAPAAVADFRRSPSLNRLSTTRTRPATRRPTSPSSRRPAARRSGLRGVYPFEAYPTYAPFALPSGAYPEFVAHVPAAPFPAALSPSRSRARCGPVQAFEKGATYPTYIPFALADGPYPGSCRSPSRRWPTEAHARAVPAVLRLTPARYPGYTPFAMAPAFSHTPYAHLREHVFVPYALREPNHPRWWSTGTTGTGCATRSTSTSTT